MQRHVAPLQAGIDERHRELAGLLAGLAGVVIFGLTLPMTHIALAGFDRYFIGIGRAVPAALLAGAMLAVTRQPAPGRESWMPLALVAAGCIFGFPLMATAAMQHVPAAHGGVILALLPLATAMAGALMDGERPSPGFWLAGIAGSLLVMAFAVIEAGSLTFQAGDLLLLGATVAAAVGYAQSGRLARTMGGWQVISWALVISLPFSLLAVGLFGGPVNWSAPEPAWLAFAYVSLMSQYFGFFFWNRGMALAGTAKTGQLQLLQPFVTLIGAYFLLGEAVGLRHLGFGMAVAAIVALGRRLRVERRAIA
jgi:drug/metabolite transporter (DMT)-like permease